MTFITRPLGADPSTTDTTAAFKLGTLAYGDDGKVYAYVLSSGSVAAYACTCVDEDWTMRGATNTLAADASRPAWPQVAFATDSYGWAVLEGSNFSGKVKDGVSANVALYTSASVGIMGTDASTGNPYLICGVKVAVAGSGAGAAVEIIASSPCFKAPAL